MEHRRGELAYKAVLDKRVCPGCGAEQSYDEASSSANPNLGHGLFEKIISVYHPPCFSFFCLLISLRAPSPIIRAKRSNISSYQA